MGNGKLDTSIGLGDATVFNPNTAIQQFGNIIAQQKAQKQAQDQALINQASQLKPDAIRDADKEDYQKKYNDWKQTAINAYNLPQNSQQRLNALADAQSKYNDLGDFIGESKKEAANEHGLAQQWIGNQHLFDDDAHAKFIKSMQSPMSSGDFVPGNQYQNFGRYINQEKIDDSQDKINKELLKNAQWGNPIQSQGIDKQGNKTGVVVHNEREVAPEDLMSAHMHYYDMSDDAKAALNKRYENINGSTPQETKALRVQQSLLDRGDLVKDPKTGALTSTVNESTKPEFKANRAPDNFYAHYDYRLANPTGLPGGGQPQPMNIPFAGGKGVVHAPNYVPLSLPNKNFAGAAGINMETGKPEAPLNSSDQYSIVGAGDFPTLNNPNNEANGTLVQPDFAAKNPNLVQYKRMVHVRQLDPNTRESTDHLVDYNTMPKNVANQKDVKGALQGLNNTPVYGTSGHIKPNKKVTDVSSIFN